MPSGPNLSPFCAARSFFGGSTPAEKYKLFMEANQLDVLKASYQDIANHLRKIQEVVAVRAHTQTTLEDELRSAEKDYNDIRQITVEKQKLKLMIMERQWVRCPLSPLSLAQWTCGYRPGAALGCIARLRCIPLPTVYF